MACKVRKLFFQQGPLKISLILYTEIVRAYRVLFYIFKFGNSEGYCSTYHTTHYLGLEWPAVAFSLTSILPFKGMVS